MFQYVSYRRKHFRAIVSYTLEVKYWKTEKINDIEEQEAEIQNYHLLEIGRAVLNSLAYGNKKSFRKKIENKENTPSEVPPVVYTKIYTGRFKKLAELLECRFVRYRCNDSVMLYK